MQDDATAGHPPRLYPPGHFLIGHIRNIIHGNDPFGVPPLPMQDIGCGQVQEVISGDGLGVVRRDIPLPHPTVI